MTDIVIFGYIYERKGNTDLAGESFSKAYIIYGKAEYSGYQEDQGTEAVKRLGHCKERKRNFSFEVAGRHLSRPFLF